MAGGSSRGARAFEAPGARAFQASDWRTDHQLWIEFFVLFNFAGLVADIFLAHSQNHFHRVSEYVPLYFSIAATVTLAAVAPLRGRMPAVWRDIGYLVG